MTAAIHRQARAASDSLAMCSEILRRLRMVVAEQHEFEPDALEVSVRELLDEVSLLVRTAGDQVKLVAQMRRAYATRKDV